MMDSLKGSVILCLALLITGCAGATPKGNSGWFSHTETGTASFYAMIYQGKKTASGEAFNQSAKTAAHKTLPFGTRVNVTNTDNGKSVTVRINDRGPFVPGRVIDLSQTAFKSIGSLDQGIIPVTITVVD